MLPPVPRLQPADPAAGPDRCHQDHPGTPCARRAAPWSKRITGTARGDGRGPAVLTATPASEHARTTDPGVVRGLTRLTDPDGFFLVCALDHVTDFVALLPPGTPYTE